MVNIRTRNALQLYREVRRKEPDTDSQDYLEFCLLVHNVNRKIGRGEPMWKYAEGEERRVWRLMRGR